MEDALAGADAQRAAGCDLGGLGLFAVGVAPDVGAGGAARDEVVAFGVLDLAHVFPFYRVFAGAGDEVGEVVWWERGLVVVFGAVGRKGGGLGTGRTVGLDLGDAGQDEGEVDDEHFGGGHDRGREDLVAGSDHTSQRGRRKSQGTADRTAAV